MRNKTTPPLRGTPPREGNKSTPSRTRHSLTGEENSPPLEGWQAKPDGVVPNLRFPEFRGKGGWKREKLGRLIDIKGRIGYRGYTVNDIVREGEGAISLSPSNIDDAGYISFENSTYISWNKYEESPEIMLEEGFTVLVKTGSSFGKAALVHDLPVKTTINPQIVILKPLNINSIFLFLAVSNFSIQKQIRKNAVGGAIPTLSQDNISKFDVMVPGPKEQQKIADCLTSIDEMITAQTQKLDTLKAHKKGLMQQLFPAECETVPKLRFPEFRDKGAWEKKQIGEVLIEQSRPIEMKDEQDYSLVTVKRRYGGVVSRGVLKGESIKVKSQFSLKANDFLISKRQIVHCACGLVPEDLEGSIVSNEYAVLRARKDHDILFFNYFSQQFEISQSFLECAIGIHIEKMLFKLDDWLKHDFLFPPHAEQKKIASFLSSIDDLITAQTQKLDALKAHKKGLMQHLFPSIDEVNG